ncbi:MAG: 30S ribosomal protein S8 [Nitrospirota bacterium]
MTDPIADMLTRVRNAVMRKHKGVFVPHSNLKQEVARILKEEDFIQDYKVIETDGKKELKIFLKYVTRGESVIVGLERLSKPGRRVYVKWDEVPKVKGGIGISILSTSKGLMTQKQSGQSKVGGELLCSIW